MRPCRGAAVSAGEGQTRAVTPSGGVRCWGNNDDGQLGNQGTASGSLPVDVVNAWSEMTAVSAGQSYSCAPAVAGAAKCWGGNDWGQWGGRSSSRYSPAPKLVSLPASVCPPAPAQGCMHAGKTVLLLAGAGGERQTIWIWVRREAPDPTELGDPTTRTRYALCLYSGGGLVLAAEDLRRSCAGERPCWRMTPAKGFRYVSHGPRPTHRRLFSLWHPRAEVQDRPGQKGTGHYCAGVAACRPAHGAVEWRTQRMISGGRRCPRRPTP